VSDFETPYEAQPLYEPVSPIEEAYITEERFDQEIEQDYAAPSSVGQEQEIAASPSLESEDQQLASELDANAEQTFENTMNQAESFDQTLNDG
jgi:hypothetical protein